MGSPIVVAASNGLAGDFESGFAWLLVAVVCTVLLIWMLIKKDDWLEKIKQWELEEKERRRK